MKSFIAFAKKKYKALIAEVGEELFHQSFSSNVLS